MIKTFARTLLAAALAAVALTCSGCLETTRGEKVGTIVQLRQSGVMCPTWEAEIVRGGLNNGSGVLGGAFWFTVEDTSMLGKVRDALETQQEVKITFRREFATLCRSDSGNDFLTSIADFRK